MAITGCAQSRDNTPPLSKDTTEEGADYTFPHSAKWSVLHAEYVAKNGKTIAGTGKDCKSCHDGLNLKTPALSNVSCATSCHSIKSAAPAGTAPASILPVAPSAPAAPIAVVDNQCSSCHADHQHRPNGHFPAAAGLCKACHDVKPGHLTDPKGNKVTNKSVADTCLACHGNMQAHSVIHPALTQDPDSCITCHNPHGSDQIFSLRLNIQDTCLQCHDMMPDKSKSIHGVIKSDSMSCVNCHFPHSGDNKKMLRGKPRELCLSCHNQEVSAVVSNDPRTLPNIGQKVNDAAFIHSAAYDDDSCINCHNAHAAKNTRLLKNNYPSTYATKYDAGSPAVGTAPARPNSYALCFQCHNPSMLNQNISGAETNFHDDKLVNGKVVKKNLHWFHVVDAAGSIDKDRGKSCFVCHDPHGSEQPFHIKTEWKMNPGAQFSVTVPFTQNPDGGQCAQTCHTVEMRDYKRLQQQ
ncbi:cytochrome c3 family protein [Bdellovibrionota bacterium FG-1]